MSKAEDLALEKYPSRSVLVVPSRGGGYYADSHLREGFIEGYNQAEKDNELTWEDIAGILDITDVIANDDSMEERLRTMSEEEYCQEVLKRFKAKKWK